MLRSDAVVRRWYDTLVATKLSIETQFATYKIERAEKYYQLVKGIITNDDYMRWVEEKNKWRAGALRFKASVEAKIAESKKYLRVAEGYWDE